jgi:hypothetical protein
MRVTGQQTGPANASDPANETTTSNSDGRPWVLPFQRRVSPVPAAAGTVGPESSVLHLGQQEHALTQDKPAGQPREARPKTPQRTTGYQKAECQTQT